jgi:hypothetical protein
MIQEFVLLVQEFRAGPSIAIDSIGEPGDIAVVRFGSILILDQVIGATARPSIP